MTVYGHSGYGHSGAPEVGAPKQLSVATFLSFLSTVPAYLVVVWRVTEVLLERGPVREGETWAGIYGVVAFMGVVWVLSCRFMLWWIAMVHARSRTAAVLLALNLACGALLAAVAVPILNELGRLDMRFPLLAMAFSVIYGLLQGTAAVLLVTPSSWRYYR